MLKTAEYVSSGHPDKICDRISDAILDAYLKVDPYARVAVETMGGHGKIALTGEVSSKQQVDHVQIVHRVLQNESIEVIDFVSISQSPDIALGVDTGGAGDQGIMVGYASGATSSLLPLELELARTIITKLPTAYGPDAKAQVTLDTKDEIQSLVLSAQHTAADNLKELQNYARSYQARNYFINHTGRFVIGGFEADSGLTGRKLAVDNYGPSIPLGGGAFSGKDPTKVDRSGAYMARWIAVQQVRVGDLQEALVKIAYAIGEALPVMITLEGKNSRGRRIYRNLTSTYQQECRPQAVIERFDLLKPQYEDLATHGHFGRNLIWER